MDPQRWASDWGRRDSTALFVFRPTSLSDDAATRSPRWILFVVRFAYRPRHEGGNSYCRALTYAWVWSLRAYQMGRCHRYGANWVQLERRHARAYDAKAQTCQSEVAWARKEGNGTNVNLFLHSVNFSSSKLSCDCTEGNGSIHSILWWLCNSC